MTFLLVFPTLKKSQKCLYLRACLTWREKESIFGSGHTARIRRFYTYGYITFRTSGQTKCVDVEKITEQDQRPFLGLTIKSCHISKTTISQWFGQGISYKFVYELLMIHKIDIHRKFFVSISQFLKIDDSAGTCPQDGCFSRKSKKKLSENHVR